jgi:20S proteasome subunit alpha 7|eukprot:COSAG01_NODE_68_length_28978_cov_182.027777_4_plen_66_part_00
MLHQCHDELKDKNFEVEMSWICEESGREHQLVPADVVAAATEAAKAALASDSSDEDEDEDVQMAD